MYIYVLISPACWGCRIHQLHLSQQMFWYNIKQSDYVATVMLALWGMQSTTPLPLFPGPLWPGVVALDRVLSVEQIELSDI